MKKVLMIVISIAILFSSPFIVSCKKQDTAEKAAETGGYGEEAEEAAGYGEEAVEKAKEAAPGYGE
jgi:hypothetical protein